MVVGRISNPSHLVPTLRVGTRWERGWGGFVRMTLDQDSFLSLDQVIVTFGTDDLLTMTPILITSVDQADVAEAILTDLFSETFPDADAASLRRDDLLIVGHEASLKRMEAADAFLDEVPPRFAGFPADSPLNHRLLIAPPRMAVQVAAAMTQALGRSPRQGMSPEELVLGIDALDLRFSLPPEPRAECWLMTGSEKVTAEIAETIEGGRLIPPPLAGHVDIDVRVGENRVFAKMASQGSRIFLNALVDDVYVRAVKAKRTANLRQVALAMHNHHSAFRRFPELATTDADGDPLLSWRVKLAPFMGEQQLWQAIKADKAWDSEENRPFIAQMPEIFQAGDCPPGMTRLRMPVIEDSFWNDPKEPKTFRMCLDGTVNTVMLAVAPEDQAVEWTRPGVWTLDEDDLVGSFFGNRRSAYVLTFDGAAHLLDRATMTDEKLRALLTHQGREVVRWDR